MKIIREIHLGYVGTWPLVNADLDGDGVEEFLVGSGDARFLRAYGRTGKALWQICLSNFCDGQSLPVDAFDLDGDGRAEVYAPDEMGRRLIRLDGRTGKVTARSQELPGSGLDGLSAPYGFRQYQGLRPRSWDGKGPSLYASCKGGFVVALDADLKVLWVRDGLGKDIEHYVFRGDVDGDRQDEVLVSAQDASTLYLVDHDEKLLRSFNIPTEIGKDTHVDFLVIDDVDEDGKMEIVTSTGYDLREADGKLRWSLAGKVEGLGHHGQWVQTGKIRKDIPHRQILYLEAEGGLDPSRMMLVSADGRVLWTFGNFRTTAYTAGFIDRRGTGDYEVFACEAGRRDRLKGLPNVYWDKNRQIQDPSESYDVVILSPHGEETDRLSFQDVGGPGAYDGVYGGAVASAVADIEGDGRQVLALITYDGRLLLLR